ncbi:cysteine proteinase [Auriculariales sp. MPI-PUGE-AT-0066]|nr:cysteine proteinase [Auriculariales sp. MPI-PUGE-AT-0066]
MPDKQSGETASTPSPKLTHAQRHRQKYKSKFVQRPSQAGLLVTKELDAAVARCKAQVERIASGCRKRNIRYRDIEFDLEGDRERCLHGLATPEAERLNPPDVLRVHQIFEDPQFIVDGFSTGDVVQGGLGDCYFLSALANVSTVEGLMEKCCVARDEKAGVYGFIFWRDCHWTEVIVDDQLYVKIPTFESLTSKEKMLYHNDRDRYAKSARRGSNSLFFAKSGTDNETWVPIMEKAYAKLHGDYASLSGGFTGEAVEDMTGGVTTTYYLKDIIDPDRFWEEELLRVNVDRTFACGIDQPRTEDDSSFVTIDGILTGHAYSIIKAVEHRGKRYLRIRNPWGNASGLGAASTLKTLGHTIGNDGEFMMEYCDWLDIWTDVERTKLFDESWRMSSLWLNVPTRPLPSPWSFGDVSFTFDIPKRTNCVIVLAQIDTRYFKEISGCYLWSLDFSVFKDGSEEPLVDNAHQKFFGRSINAEIELDEGNYVVHVCPFDAFITSTTDICGLKVRLDRFPYREEDYFEAGITTAKWDKRKLGQVWAQEATGKSIAENFDPELWRSLLTAGINKFAGRDLTTVEINAHALARTKRLAAKPNTETPQAEDNRTGIYETPETEKSNGTTENATKDPAVAIVESTETDILTCDACKVSPLKPPLYICMHPSCSGYHLCSKCIENNSHPLSIASSASKIQKISNPYSTRTIHLSHLILHWVYVCTPKETLRQLFKVNFVTASVVGWSKD